MAVMHVVIGDCMLPPDSFFEEWRAELPRALLQVQSVCPKDVQDYGAQARISRHRCQRVGRLRTFKSDVSESSRPAAVEASAHFCRGPKTSNLFLRMGYHKFATI